MADEVEAYIQGLSSVSEKAQIYQYLERQTELGYRLKAPVSKPLREGINELRPGPHRLLFFYHKGRIVMVHVFRKKTQVTPNHEIEAAVRKKEGWVDA